MVSAAIFERIKEHKPRQQRQPVLVGSVDLNRSLSMPSGRRHQM